MSHRRRNLYWPEEVDKKAENLAWENRMSVSKLLTELVIRAAAKQKKTEAPESTPEPNADHD